MAEAGKDADAPHRNQRGHRTALLIIDMINCLANSMGASIDATLPAPGDYRLEVTASPPSGVALLDLSIT